jgi:hypothetical protein
VRILLVEDEIKVGNALSKGLQAEGYEITWAQTAMPSKLIHPTAWGLREVNSLQPPLYNNLNCLHELIVQLVLIHRRQFVDGKKLTPMMCSAMADFLSVWICAQTSFGGMLRE